MNTSGYTRSKRPRSIAKLTADLRQISGDLCLIDHAIKVQRDAHISPGLWTPRITNEDIHQLHNALWVLVTFGLQLEELAKERAKWRGMTPEERRELINRHADQPTSSTVMNVQSLNPSGAPHPEDHDDTSAATR